MNVKIGDPFSMLVYVESHIFLKISFSSILLQALVQTPPGHFKQHDGHGLGRCTEMGPVKRTIVGG